MLDVAAILGLVVAVGVLVWVVAERHRRVCRRFSCFCCKRCRRRTDQSSSPETVVVQVDLASGKVRTYRDNSGHASATSYAAQQVTAGGDATPPMPTMPSRTHLGASKVSIATQTTCLLTSPSSSGSSSLSPAASVEVSLFDKSMWATHSPDRTSQLDDSGTLVDTSRETVLSATRYIDTTYFEESSEAGKEIDLNTTHPDSPDCKTREVIELDARMSRNNPFSNPFSLQVIQESPEDSDLAQSTTAVLTESNTCISPASTSTSPLISLDFEGSGSAALHGYNPFDLENAENECPDLESDRESFYTCKSGNEEASSVREMNLSLDVDLNVNQLMAT